MATKTAKRPKREPKTRQAHLDGMEPPVIKEIDDAAETYYDLNDESWKMRGKVEEARDELLEAMKRHDLTIYAYDNKTVQVIGKQVVKVKKKKENEEE